MNSRTVAGTVIEALLSSNARRATKFLTDRLTVKASRMHKPHKRNRYNTCVVTIGVPNYAEREFIRRCKQASEPFPVRKIQLQFYQPKSKR